MSSILQQSLEEQLRHDAGVIASIGNSPYDECAEQLNLLKFANTIRRLCLEDIRQVLCSNNSNNTTNPADGFQSHPLSTAADAHGDTSTDQAAGLRHQAENTQR